MKYKKGDIERNIEVGIEISNSKEIQMVCLLRAIAMMMSNSQTSDKAVKGKEPKKDWNKTMKRTLKGLKKFRNSANSKKECKDKDCDYYDVNYPKNCSTSPCSNKEKEE